MRSVLKSCLTLVDSTWGNNYLDELKWVDEVISPVRNAQVLLNRFNTYPKPLMIENSQLGNDLRHELKNSQEKLALELISPTFQQFLSYQNFETRESIPCLHSTEPVIHYLKEFNRAAWKSLSKAIAKADDDHLHKVRIKAKETKYLAEASIPVIGKTLKDNGKIAGNIQSALGYLQDSLMMTAATTSVEILEYEKKERKQIKSDWRKFVKHNF